MHPKEIEGKPDFFFPEARVVVFIDGCFWHGCRSCYRRPNSRQSYWDWKLARNRKRDQKVNRLLKGQGYRVLRFWEHDAARHLHKIIAGIVEALRRFVEPED